MHPSLQPRYARKKPQDKVKFGNSLIRRWQFALIIVAIVLAAVLVAYVAYRVYRKRIPKGAPRNAKDDKEWDAYLAELRAKKGVDAGGRT